MSKWILTFVLLIASVSGAKTLVISDIDDTVKISHVLDKMDAANNAFETGNLFLGMNWVFRVLKHENKDIKFFYMSNAPASLMEGLHREFLASNRFPSGAIRLREGLFQSDFKITEGRKILRKEKPQDVILLGDNGERDILIYNQLQQEFPDIRFYTYIHLVYYSRAQDDSGARLMEQQTGFATSLDLLLDLTAKGFATPELTAEFIKVFAPAYLQEGLHNTTGMLAFPEWQDCRDFRWTAADTFADVPGYTEAKARIQNRCGHKIRTAN